ncbi:MAG: DoxX family membrane protein [Patescibacteria group bacterium]|nr:DoxX family membrane protein [Patescibacteria group bacterium]MDE1944238.1 DoxX family membrane protein [Patescibacteria group bacterium]MDE1945326.1 DoxX family membrane protein [Patescibacteria group bacterium]MDE2057816.1 DoxX family membrane protein [Patescibacteria group bacterium]
MSRSSNAAAAHFVLRLGLAFAFLYPPYAALSDPLSWEGYFPPFVHALPVSPLVLLHALGVVEVGIAVWVLSGWKIRLPALAAAALLLAIVGFNTFDFEILFRDLAIASIAVALALWPTATKRTVRGMTV